MLKFSAFYLSPPLLSFSSLVTSNSSLTGELYWGSDVVDSWAPSEEEPLDSIDEGFKPSSLAFSLACHCWLLSNRKWDKMNMQLNAFLHYEESLCVSGGRRKEIISQRISQSQEKNTYKIWRQVIRLFNPGSTHAFFIFHLFIYLYLYIFMRLPIFVTGSDLGVPWFASPRSLIGLENSCHPLNQSDAKHRSIVKWPLAFSRVWGWLMLVLFTHEFSQASCHIYFWSDRPLCAQGRHDNVLLTFSKLKFKGMIM